MKYKYIIPILLWVLSFSVNLKAQTIFFDDFQDSTLANWTVDNLYDSSNVVWKWADTARIPEYYPLMYPGFSNGHIIVDSDGDGDVNSIIREYTTITSKAIDCSGHDTVILNFYDHFWKYLTDTAQVFISNDSVNWIEVYNPGIGLAAYETTGNPNLVDVNISSIAANSTTVYIRFSWKGSWELWWIVDDVRLFVPDQNDAKVTQLVNQISNGCQLSNAEPLQLNFTNKGLAPISMLQAKYSINGSTPVSEMVMLSTPLLYDSSYQYTFTATADFSATGMYDIKAWVELTGDTLNANDTTNSYAVSAATANVPYTMGFEVPPAGTELGGLLYTAEDVNNDGLSWYLVEDSATSHSGNTHYQHNSDGSLIADDWLFTQCLNFTANTFYKVSFYAEAGSDDNATYDEKLELYAGMNNQSAVMNDFIYDFGLISNGAYEEKVAAFQATMNGTHYIGFHSYTDSMKLWLNIDDINVTVLNPPTPQFTVLQNGLMVTVADSSYDVITNWEWNWGDGTAPGTGKDPGMHMYAIPGPYLICLKVTNLAGVDSICQTINITTGIDEASLSSQVAVYPNPAYNIINVKLSDIAKGNAIIEVINKLGETVLMEKASGNAKDKIDITSIEAGAYMIKISSGEITVFKRFVHIK